MTGRFNFKSPQQTRCTLIGLAQLIDHHQVHLIMLMMMKGSANTKLMDLVAIFRRPTIRSGGNVPIPPVAFQLGGPSRATTKNKETRLKKAG